MPRSKPWYCPYKYLIDICTWKGTTAAYPEYGGTSGRRGNVMLNRMRAYFRTAPLLYHGEEG